MNGLTTEAAATERCTDKLTPLYYLITTRATHSFSLVLNARPAAGDTKFELPAGRTSLSGQQGAMMCQLLHSKASDS